MACKPTRFPNGIFVGGCFQIGPDVVIPTTDVIVEVSNAESPYQMAGVEDIIFCTGIVEILMIPLASADKSFIVNADGGTVTMTPAGADTVQTPTIVAPNSGKFGPKASINQWRDL